MGKAPSHRKVRLRFLQEFVLGRVRCSAKLFANETSLFSVAKNLNENATKLTGDLKNMSKCAHQWKISFNSDATKMEKEIFKSKKSKFIYPNLTFY